MTAKAAITTHDLACGYGRRPIIEGVNVSLPHGRISCVLGKSGCGKSTLLRTLLLLESPLAGDVRFDGASIFGLSGRELDELRQRTGVLFQGAALFNSMTLLENAAFPLVERSGLPPDLAAELALLKLDLVGLAPFAHYLPSAVSGGMRKRCGIARALALDPPYLLLDEPSAGLDPVTSAEIDALILEIRDTLATTVVVVTHEIRSIERIADHVVMLADGRVVAEGNLSDVRSSGVDAVEDFFDRSPPPSNGRAEDGIASLLLD